MSLVSTLLKKMQRASPNDSQTEIPTQSLNPIEDKIDDQEDIIIMSDIKEITKLFVKEQIIIWYDPNPDTLENVDFLTELEKDYLVKRFSGWKKASNTIKEISVSFQLIMSGINKNLPVELIDIMSKVNFLYILTSNKEDLYQLFKGFSQNIFIEENFKDILSQVNLNTKRWQRESSSLRVDFPAFVSIFDDLDKSQINYQHLYLKGLINFQNRSQAKRDFLILSKTIYQDIQNIEAFEQTYNEYNMASILKWYTKECFLYKVTNNCLRIASSDSIQYCRLILKDLETAIKEQYQTKSKNFNGLLYRGAYISHEEWMRLEQNIGKEIEMYGFLSTSKIRNIALNFAQKDSNKKVFITIIVPKSIDNEEQGFAELREFSEFKEEEEILFNVRSRFRILDASFEQINGFGTRHLILLYGAQGIRKYLRETNANIEICVNNKEQLACKGCGIIKNENVFIDLYNKENLSICENCVDNLQHEEIPALFFLPKELEFPYEVKIEGMISRFTTDTRIPFYRYQCAECEEKRQECYFRCLTCKDELRFVCKKCWKSDNNCKINKHLFALERNPFTLWTKKMTEKEFAYLEYQKELSQKSKLFHQAETFYQSHDYIKTIQYYEKFLEKENNLNSHLSAISYNNLGLAYFNIGNIPKAIEYHLKALEIKISIYGEQHAETVVSLNSLGAAYYSISDYAKAIEYHSKSFEIGKVINGENHPNTAVSYSNLAIIYKDLGDYKKAIEFNIKAYKIRKSVLGENHPLTVTSFDNLGDIYERLGEYQKAKNFYEKALEAKLVIYGEKHPGTAISLDNLGGLYTVIGDNQNALEHHLKALEIRLQVHGKEHQEVADSYNNLGNLCYTMGDYHQAIEYHLKSLHIKKSKYGEKNPDVAISYNNLGLVYNSIGDYEKALEYHLLDIEITKSVFGDEHPGTIISYDNLGVVYRNLGKCQEAINYHLKCIEKRESMFGDRHPDTATSYYNLGLAYEKIEENKLAMEYLIKAIKIRQVVFGKEHKDTKLIFNSLQTLIKKHQAK